MSKTTTANKELFTVLGKFRDVVVNGRKMTRFFPASEKYYLSMCSHSPKDKIINCTFSTKIPTRSNAQLRYYFVLLHYLADYSGYKSKGYTEIDLHEATMIKKYGTKTIELDGEKIEVRRSVSNRAKFPKADMVEVIEYVLELCKKLEVKVPTMRELGYLVDEQGNIIK